MERENLDRFPRPPRREDDEEAARLRARERRDRAGEAVNISSAHADVERKGIRRPHHHVGKFAPERFLDGGALLAGEDELPLLDRLRVAECFLQSLRIRAVDVRGGGTRNEGGEGKTKEFPHRALEGGRDRRGTAAS